MTKLRCRSRRGRSRKRSGRRTMRKTRCRGGRRRRKFSRRTRHPTYRRRVRKMAYPKRCARPREDLEPNLKAKAHRRLNESLKQHRMSLRMPI
uniref:Uncharacterized protein n=1 Tax=Callorhinchus milii TaxID=7868 RepID=A0A4W3IS42_CALMI